LHWLCFGIVLHFPSKNRTHHRPQYLHQSTQYRTGIPPIDAFSPAALAVPLAKQLHDNLSRPIHRSISYASPESGARQTASPSTSLFFNFDRHNNHHQSEDRNRQLIRNLCQLIRNLLAANWVHHRSQHWTIQPEPPFTRSHGIKYHRPNQRQHPDKHSTLDADIMLNSDAKR